MCVHVIFTTNKPCTRCCLTANNDAAKKHTLCHHHCNVQK